MVSLASSSSCLKIIGRKKYKRVNKRERKRKKQNSMRGGWTL